MFTRILAGLRDRLAVHREAEAELRKVSAEQFLSEIREVRDDGGRQDAGPPEPELKPPRGRHRAPAGMVYLPAARTIPRVQPACGTRPPWDIKTGSLPVIPDGPQDAGPVAEDRPAEPDSEGHPSQPGSPGDTGSPDTMDDLQRYLDSLPGFRAEEQ